MKHTALLIEYLGIACVVVAQIVNAYSDKRTGWLSGMTYGTFAGGMLMILAGLVLMLVALVKEAL